MIGNSESYEICIMGMTGICILLNWMTHGKDRGNELGRA